MASPYHVMALACHMKKMQVTPIRWQQCNETHIQPCNPPYHKAATMRWGKEWSGGAHRPSNSLCGLQPALQPYPRSLLGKKRAD